MDTLNIFEFLRELGKEKKFSFSKQQSLFSLKLHLDKIESQSTINLEENLRSHER